MHIFCKMFRLSSMVFLFVLVIRSKASYEDDKKFYTSRSNAIGIAYQKSIGLCRNRQNTQKLDLTIYYESRCPDSRTFVVKQLVPTMEILEDYIELTLLPFGKARSINGSITTFQCQHGPKECAGNMFQGCVIDLMKGRASDLRIARYVACEMETEAGTRGDLTCARQSGSNVRMVEQCTRNSKGIELQRKYEDLTKELKPKFIPTITVNGIFKRKVQEMGMRDLGLAMCRFLRNEAPCTRRFNSYDLTEEEGD